MTPNINEEEFNQWLKEMEVHYVSMSVSRKNDSGILDRLRFVYRLDGYYIVTLGLMSLYEGNNFLSAAAVFNFNAKKQTK